MNITGLLINCIIFKGLNEDQVKAILEKHQYIVRQFNKNEVVVYQGDICNQLFVILKGEVKAEMSDKNGQLLKIENISAPMPLATAFLFGNQNFFPVTVSVIQDCSIIIFSRKSILDIMTENQQILVNFLNAISNRAQFLSDRLNFLTLKSIRSKIATYLIQMATDKLKTVMLPVSQIELAEQFGVTRPALAKELSNLSKEGLIKVKGRQIELLEKDKIRSLI